MAADQNPNQNTDNIFDSLLKKTQQEKAKQADSAGEENKILSGIIEKKEGYGKILGQMPEKRDLTLLKLMRNRKKLSLGWTILKLVIFLGIVSFSYFYYELSPTFTQLDSALKRQNAVNTFSDVKARLITTQANVNANNLLSAQISIDHFSYLADLYFYYQDRLKEQERLNNNDKSKKNTYQSQVSQVTEMMFKDLEFIQTRLKKPFYPALLLTDAELTEFQAAINSETQNKIREIKKLETAAPVNFIDAQTYDGAVRLVGNQKLINTLKNLNLTELKASAEKKGQEEGENLFEKSIKDLSADINNVAQNDFSIVAKIRSKRMIWSDFIDSIEKITMKVDPYYDKKKIRQIFYSSYRFDATQGRVTVAGTTKKLDNYSFTLLSNLIDYFEKSPIFSDVKVSSLSKSKSDQYSTAPINMEFFIQNGSDPRDSKVTLGEFLAEYGYENASNSEAEAAPSGGEKAKSSAPQEGSESKSSGSSTGSSKSSSEKKSETQ